MIDLEILIRERKDSIKKQIDDLSLRLDELDKIEEQLIPSKERLSVIEKWLEDRRYYIGR